MSIDNYYGTAVVGSASLQTSVANAEILEDGKRYYNFEFANNQECHVFVNGSTSPIYLKANQGLLIDVCESFKVQESSITFNWVAVLG